MVYYSRTIKSSFILKDLDLRKCIARRNSGRVKRNNKFEPSSLMCLAEVDEMTRQFESKFLSTLLPALELRIASSRRWKEAIKVGLKYRSFAGSETKLKYSNARRASFTLITLPKANQFELSRLFTSSCREVIVIDNVKVLSSKWRSGRGEGRKSPRMCKGLKLYEFSSSSTGQKKSQTGRAEGGFQVSRGITCENRATFALT